MLHKLACLLLLVSTSAAQDYWTPRRKVETVAVTALHMADAAQTCYHLSQGNWIEGGFGTPHNCSGAAIYLVSSGPVLQYASYRLARRYRRMRFIETILPYVEIGISIRGIQGSEERTR